MQPSLVGQRLASVCDGDVSEARVATWPAASSVLTRFMAMPLFDDQKRPSRSVQSVSQSEAGQCIAALWRSIDDLAHPRCLHTAILDYTYS